MSSRFFADHILGPDTHANRPAADVAPYGALYMCTTHSKFEFNNQGAWIDYATLAGGATVPAGGTAGQVLTKDSGTDFDASWADPPTEVLMFALSDESTAITAGAGKLTIRMPFALDLTEIRAFLSVASTAAGPVTVDVNEGGSTILSTKLTIDDNEKTSTTAATPAVISDASLADDAEIVFDIDAAGTGAKGLKVAFIGTR